MEKKSGLKLNLEPGLGLLENEYRQHFLKTDIELARLGIGVGIVSTLALSYVDYLFFGLTSPFKQLLLIRLIFFVASLGVILVLRQTKQTRLFDGLMFAWWLGLVVMVVSVDYFRPPGYVQNQVLYILVAFTCYTVVPMPIFSRVIPALLLSLFDFLILHYLKTPLPRPVFTVTLAAHIITHVIGILISARMYSYRRHQYLAQVQERKALLELERLAATDDLTGLTNRRRFLELAEAELNRFRRSQNKFSLLMIDFDHFKEINDRYGHPAGDEILRQFAHRASTTKRSSDCVGRLGGEEFVVLLPETGSAGATAFANRLRTNCAQIELPFPETALHITISIGIAEIRAEDSSVYEILQRADEALYLAKNNGRDRCEII
jgi:diguanylate cyclase (GGDEF)-like protein